MMLFQFLRPFAALLGLFLLAGCASFNLGTAAQVRGLDYLNDDLASVVLAFDVPVTIEPIPDASLFRLDIVAPGRGERHLAPVLVRGDATAAAGTLRPPADGRTYYLFAFSEADKQALREAQAWARGLAGDPPQPRIALEPRFCSTALHADPRETRISVLVALPGTGAMAPLVDDVRVADLLSGTGSSSLPACAGHSG
ncbi:MAG TPA: hypothetical protein VGN80_13320 [Devosiaceae bacterium]|jgi:hypothetical protein|nr:hypothetical protein [Devosiaceae bacterium]